MEKYTEVKPSLIKKGDDSFVLKKENKMEPFKIEIVSTEFCDKISELIASTDGAVTTMNQIIEEMKKPLTMTIDAELYKDLCMIGEKDQVELVLRYVAVERITGCGEDKKFIDMIHSVRESLKEVPLHMRHVLTSDKYRKLYAVVPAAYLASVCNLEKVKAEVGRMDKSDEKTMAEIMNIVKEKCVCENDALSESYSLATEVVERILFAYRDKNIIDLGNLRKVLLDTFDGELKGYFGKLLNLMDSDIKDSFTKFTAMVKEMKELDSKEMSVDNPEPYEYDPVEMEPEQPEEQPNTGDLSIADTMNPEPPAPVDQNAGGVNTGLEGGTPATPDQNAAGQPAQPGAGGVVTGLESALQEGIKLFKKKLKRISKESVGYVKIRGANAPDADTLCMIVSYGYSVMERCEWYMSLIQSQDQRYIVPQSYGELENIKNMMNTVLEGLLKNPIVKKNSPVLDMYDI